MTKRVNFSISPTGTITTLIIFGILGYFVYDRSIDAAIGVVAISIAVGLITMLSLIPIIGWIASTLISYYWAIPAMLEIIGLEHTWLITTIFWLNVLLGLVMTILMTIVISAVFSRRR